MKSSSPLDSQTAYLDFSQFGKIKSEYRADSEAGMQATARQLEGVFLNMMLKSMRQANSAFSEGNYLGGRESEQYRDMYDQQLTQNLTSGRGIGLAEMIVRQMKQLENRGKDTDNPEQRSYEISAYRDRVVPALLRPDLKAGELDAIAQDMEKETEEARLFSPTVQPISQRQAVTADWQTAEEFVDAIMPHALRAARQLNVDPMAIVAQAVLETGWGRHVMQNPNGEHSFNLFGIKASAGWEGDTVRKKTLEYRNGIAAPEHASFRSYPSLESAFDDYVNFLKGNPRYQGVFDMNIDSKQWGFALQEAGYATDPHYGNKIARLMEGDILRAKSQSITSL